ncbi:MAG: adenylate/guanylate cyclase domain-containing protein [Acidimicrobiia bacterium]|nr:adenylate/guanylate cyclase domain-containing protein [Acidimicrobiia bacterium]
MATPQVIDQRLLPPGSSVEVGPYHVEGRYRVRARERPGSQTLDVRPGGEAAVFLHCGDEGWPDHAPVVAPTGVVTLTNDTADEQLLVVDRAWWSDDAVTGAEVIALQDFRDLFASEALRPGERIEVGTATLAFTDLRGSTRFYREVGDAVAFGQVLDHFEVLTRAIRDERGAVVKTIGDAVMAVFPSPVRAVRALVRATEVVATRSAGQLELKAGVHSGPCIAVTLNGRLDYFGTSVNLAARLEGLSAGGDVVVSDAVVEDPEVRRLFEVDPPTLAAQPLSTTLKGFEDEIRVWRLRTA